MPFIGDIGERAVFCPGNAPELNGGHIVFGSYLGKKINGHQWATFLGKWAENPKICDRRATTTDTNARGQRTQLLDLLVD